MPTHSLESGRLDALSARPPWSDPTTTVSPTLGGAPRQRAAPRPRGRRPDERVPLDPDARFWVATSRRPADAFARPKRLAARLVTTAFILVSGAPRASPLDQRIANGQRAAHDRTRSRGVVRIWVCGAPATARDEYRARTHAECRCSEIPSPQDAPLAGACQLFHRPAGGKTAMTTLTKLEASRRHSRTAARLPLRSSQPAEQVSGPRRIDASAFRAREVRY
jgi:hypothetical protein